MTNRLLFALALVAILVIAPTVLAKRPVVERTLTLVEHLVSDPAAPFANRGSFTFESSAGGGYLVFHCLADWTGISESHTPPVNRDGSIPTIYYRNGLHHSGQPYCARWEAWIAVDGTVVSNVLGGEL